MLGWLLSLLAFGVGGSLTAKFAHQKLRSLFLPRHAAPVPADILIGNVESADTSGEIVAKAGTGLEVNGWAAFTRKSPIRQLDVLIDGKLMATIERLTLRPDVAEAYGRADFELSGWQAAVALEEVSAGRHALMIHATAVNGQSARLRPVILVVHP